MHERRPQESGIAIITVLSVLLLMSVLVLAFFSLAANEYTASNNYEYSIRSRQAADTAISMVIGQIRKATTQKNEGASQGYRAWASQPGAITTFEAKNSYLDFKEAAQTKFKLYSSDKMEEFGDYNTSLDVPADWIDFPNIWCDLNDPVVEEADGDVRLHFPIVDPRAFVGTWSESEGIDNRDGPDGFGYTDETSAGAKIEGITFANGRSDVSARLPMPVRWLYMLDDGTMGYLSDKGTFVRTYGTGDVSKENPLSYRFAFWTDDESSKLNINTASEGQYWDLPRGTGTDEVEFAKYQPQKNELQRFPGQPAVTSLSPVFAPGEQVDRRIEEAIYGIVPKIQWGGTEGGKKTGTPVVPDEDRLFSDIDEFLYDAKMREESQSFRNLTTKEDLERARFLITANSRAPELTLWGTPRICMWSMYSTQSGKTRTAYDRSIAYCATLPRSGSNSTEYYFLRNNAASRHNENYDQVGGHNSKLLEGYLYPFTDVTNPIPGYGGSFATKFGAGPFGDARQIATQMMDYIRNINVADPLSQGYFQSGGPGQVAPMCMCGGTGPHNTRWASKQAYPKGYGRHYTLSEAALVFITTAEKTNQFGIRGDTRNVRGLADNQKRIQVGIVLESFCPSHGFMGILPNTTFQVVNGNIPLTPSSNAENKQNEPEIVIAESPFDKNKVTVVNNKLVGNNDATMPGRRVWGGTGGGRLCLTDASNRGITFSGVNSDGSVSDGHIVVSASTGTMTLKETTLRIIIYDQKSNTSLGNSIQVFDCTFPETTIPVPDYDTAATDTWQERINSARNLADGEDKLILGGKKDSVRSVVVSHGDYRVVAAKRVVVSASGSGKNVKSHMKPHPDYFTNNSHAHSLVTAEGKTVNEGTHASLVEGVAYPDAIAPDYPMNPSEADYATLVDPSYPYTAYLSPSNSGDFDNGLSISADGAYINRADDGRAGTDAYFGSLDRIGSQAAKNQAPNRLVYGSGMFGSLSSGVQSNIPWRTLLFRPDPLHFGAKHRNVKLSSVTDPPDHLFMDLFWMPVVEPYPISEPFSTAGKVNLNCQIAPFDYIKRQTALHGILKGERILAIPTSAVASYKSAAVNFRKEIDANETLKQFEDRFRDGEIFRSATEICEMYLVPVGEKLGTRSKVKTPVGDDAYDYPSMRSFWARHKLTGDNSKERPYAGIYPRVTTKSNVYKMHMTVQSLKKARSTEADEWDPERDRVTSQWRGSAVIERAVDPNDSEIPDYAVGNFTSKPNVEVFYNYRVLNVRQFSP